MLVMGEPRPLLGQADPAPHSWGQAPSLLALSGGQAPSRASQSPARSRAPTYWYCRCVVMMDIFLRLCRTKQTIRHLLWHKISRQNHPTPLRSSSRGPFHPSSSAPAPQGHSSHEPFWLQRGLGTFALTSTGAAWALF